MNTQDFSRKILEICRPETSFQPEQWSPENPLLGHCVPVALLAQDLFGGDILRISLAQTEFVDAKSHFFNMLPAGEIFDFTIDQFQGRLPTGIEFEKISREEILQPDDTKRRYELLRTRWGNSLSG